MTPWVRDLLVLVLTALSSGGLVALAQAVLAHRRHRPTAPEGARVIVEGAGAAVVALQATLQTMHEELVERDRRIDKLEAKVAAKDEELIALRVRVAGLETELHVYRKEHP